MRPRHVHRALRERSRRGARAGLAHDVQGVRVGERGIGREQHAQSQAGELGQRRQVGERVRVTLIGHVQRGRLVGARLEVPRARGSHARPVPQGQLLHVRARGIPPRDERAGRRGDATERVGGARRGGDPCRISRGAHDREPAGDERAGEQRVPGGDEQTLFEAGRVRDHDIEVPPPGRASAQGFPLTVESIMRGPDVVGTAPSNVRFSADGRYVYFAWRSPGVDTLDQDYRVAVAGAPQASERLPRFAVDTIAMATGGSAWSPDLRREVVVLKGDVWLVERTGAKRRLTQTPSPESDPAWSADGRSVFFTREGNAWALGLDDGALRQLTDIRRGPAPKPPGEPTGERKFLRDQQRDLFDFVRRQVAEERMRADTDTVHTVKPLYLAERQSATQLEVAPDARFVLVTVTERTKGDSVEGRQVVLPS